MNLARARTISHVTPQIKIKKKKKKFHKNLRMFRQKLLKTCIFFLLLAFCRQTNKKRKRLHRTESLQMFNVSFTLLAYCEILQYLWRFINSFGILAHRSRRLTRWAYRMGLEPASVRASVRACVHTFKHEYLRDQQADYNQILSEASLGWGKGCIRFWCRSDQISGFHGNG